MTTVARTGGPTPRIIIPFGREDGIVAQWPEERYYGTQKPDVVQLTVTVRGESVRCIVPAHALRAIADWIDPVPESGTTADTQTGTNRDKRDA